MKRIWKHRLSNKQTDLMRADCLECGPNVRIVRKDNGYACRTARMLATEDESRGKVNHTIRNKHLMVSVCQICGISEGLVADVNGKTQLFRGTLCGFCNCAIGLLRDSAAFAQKAAEYLSK